jgi:hypothetical protein
MRPVLHQLSLARLLRLGLTLAILPLLYEIVVLHYRGAFHSRFMWAPVLSLPVVMAGGVASGLEQDERRSRGLFRPFAWLMALVGALGTFFHLRGIARQMGGFRNWKYNVVTGPPLPAPIQVALLGLLGVAASRRMSGTESKQGDQRKIVRSAQRINSFSYLLVGTEAAYYHWTGNFFNPSMFIPVVLSPIMALVHVASLGRSRLARALELPLSALSTLVGLVGFGFHIANVLRRPGGLGWQSLFYGPPLVAPLQMSAHGLIGALLALFSEER